MDGHRGRAPGPANLAAAHRANPAAMPLALGIYLLWTAGTWFFEGRIGTLLRPDALVDRLVYALGVNLLLGIVGGLILLGWLQGRSGAPGAARSGFGPPSRIAACAALGVALGLASYVVQGAPSTDPIVVTNAFAQVFVVSAAEVIVCWALVGGALEAALAPRLGRAATVLASVVAAALFGVYHFAHSAPFDTWAMVALLAVVGLVTGAFFVVSRDMLGTALFHNFLGTYGVTRALAEGGQLKTFETLQVPLVGTALTTMAVVLAGYWWVRSAGRAAARAPLP